MLEIQRPRRTGARRRNPRSKEAKTTITVQLLCPHCRQPLLVPTHQEGAAYYLSGHPYAEMEVSRTYEMPFREGLYPDRKDVRSFREFLHGQSARFIATYLEAAVVKLGSKTDEDYWRPTPGNAGHCLAVLLSWARRHPEGVFEVT